MWFWGGYRGSNEGCDGAFSLDISSARIRRHVNFWTVASWTLLGKWNNSIKEFHAVVKQWRSRTHPVAFTGDDPPVRVFVDVNVLCP